MSTKAVRHTARTTALYLLCLVVLLSTFAFRPSEADANPFQQTYQAENASFSGANVQTSNSGYTGTGYVDYNAASGGYIQWTVNVPSAGDYRLDFRQANGGSAKPLELKVNNVVVNGSLSFPSTGNWTTWANVTEDVALNAGNNTIRITTTGSNGSNVDALQVTELAPVSATYQAEDASFSGANVQTSNAGYTGTGYVDFSTASGGYIQWTVSVASAGDYRLDFRQANGASARTLELKVNNVVVNGSLSFPSTGSWTTWASVTEDDVALNSGNNTIRITTTGSNGSNVDALVVTGTSSGGGGAQPLGLFYTEEELDIWRDRAANGPYETASDVVTNSPGDWDRVVANKNLFMADPDGARYNPSWGSGCLPGPSNTYAPNVTKVRYVRDAAFYALLMDDATVANAVIDELLAQAGTANADFSNTSRFCPTNAYVSDNNPWLEISEFLSKLLLSLDYVKGWTTSAERDTLDEWFKDGGDYLLTAMVESFDDRFVDRQNGNYTPTLSNDPYGGGTSAPFYGSATEVGHYGKIYNNRYGSMFVYIALLGLYQDLPYYQEQAKLFAKEYLRFSVYPDFFVGEFYRKTDSLPDLGWSYAYAIVGHISVIAEAFARAGDMDIYEYETTAGVYGSAGTPTGWSGKSLRYALHTLGKHGDGTFNRYGTDNPSNLNSNYLIDGRDPLNGSDWRGNHEIFAAISNQYFDDAYLEGMYKRNGTGRQPYYANPAMNGSHSTVWEGPAGLFPGVLFLFGQMEDLVDPYPNP